MIKPVRIFFGFAALAAMAGLNVGCHNASMTAGRPGAESTGSPGSVVATNAGTGDARVSSHGTSSGASAAPEKSANVNPNQSETEEKDSASGKEAAPKHQ